MDKKQLKNFRHLSARLPVQFTEGKARVKGEEIISIAAQRSIKDKVPFEIPKDKNGVPIDSEKWYEFQTNHPVNHYRRMKRVYQSHGWDGIKDYATQVINLHYDAMDNHKRMMAAIPNANSFL